MPSLNVHLLPRLVDSAELAGGTAVVIDLLRATTTITAALAAGARAVVPCLEIDEARQIAAGFPPGEVLLGGERGGEKIPGFDLGNSPAEYTREAVAGRTLVFTTTNGTRAMRHARRAEQILLAAAVNLSAVARVITQHGGGEMAPRGAEAAPGGGGAPRGGSPRSTTIDILCAGTDGQVTAEDTLLAGWLVAAIEASSPPGNWRLNDAALLAERAARDAGLTAERLAELARLPSDARWLWCAKHVSPLLADSLGGRNLREIGLATDIDAAGQVDRHAIVPRLDVSAWRITAH